MADMASTQYVTAFFDNEADAEAAVARIAAEGVPRDQIRLVAGNPEGDVGPDRLTAEPRDKGFFEGLSDFFMPEEDRYAYAEGLSRGGFLVSLYTTPENQDRILDILDDEGTVDMDAREESWRSEGWRGYQASPSATRVQATNVSSTAASTTAASELDTAPNSDKIDVVEEQLRVGKRQAGGGRVRVRVRSYVVETPVQEDVTLRDETVRVERRPVDRPVTGDAFADHVIEATETREEAVVSKDARVTEEIILDKTTDTRTETVRDTVRRTEVEVEDDRS